MSNEEKKPNLKSRMYESRYPKEGDIVMGKVKELEGNKATIFLVEYKKKTVLTLSEEDPPVRDLKLLRMEAFRVAQVNSDTREILLDENEPSLAEIWELEKRFQEAKFVHSVFYSVADDLKMDLKEAFKLAGWPSFEGLESLHKDENFCACENVAFKTLLLERISFMRYRSWRMKDPSRLQNCVLKQLKDICYAIALTRHAEAFFKERGDLARDEHLSIMYVFKKARDAGLVSSDSTIFELGTLVRELETEGFLHDDDWPIYINRISGPVRLLKVPHVEVFTVGEHFPEQWMVDTLVEELDLEPITCSVLMFPSYKSKSNKADDVFEPTKKEFDAYKKRRDEGKRCKLSLHTMLLTGDGVDRYRKHYLEFQDSYGDIENGDRGYLRFYSDPNTVTECVFFKNFCKND